jgi:hypothetical protein
MSPTGVFVAGKGSGFGVAVPADTTKRRVRFYVGGYYSKGQAQISMSDGSVPLYEDHSCTSSGSATGSYNCIYDVEYRAGSDGQKLQLGWTQFDNGSNVSLQSATVLAPTM